jgi:phage terminase small subunit
MRKKTDKDQWKGGLIVRHDTEDSVLNPQQEAFVEAYVANGGNAAAAAVAVGYEQSNGKALIANHKVREAIELKRDTDIKTAGATQAWQVMQGLLTDPTAPAQVRFQAARWTLEASGHGLSAVAAALAVGNRGKKDLHDMSVSELQEIADRARTWLDSMKTVVKTAESFKDSIDADPSQP